jgi:hypothetical protein
VSINPRLAHRSVLGYPPAYSSACLPAPLLPKRNMNRHQHTVFRCRLLRSRAPPPPSPLPVCLRSNFPPARPSHRSYPPSPPPVLRSPDCNGSPAVCRIYTKGAPEIVLERCSHVLGPDGRRQPLPDEQKRQLLAGFAHGGQRWAGRGGRL